MAAVQMGSALFAEATGTGAPLLLLHGFTGSGADWEPHLPVLSRRFRAITVDLLGHGRSDAPANRAPYRMERCLKDLAGVLERFDVERVAVLGYSMGGRIALALALAVPQRVRALVLESASPGIAGAAERAARVAADEALAARIESDGVEAFVDFWMAQPLFASQARLGSQALAAARAARCANRAVGLANSLRGVGAGAQEPLWTRLGELRPPTLLVVGKKDEKFRRIAGAMAERIPAVETAVVPDAGHNTHLENPRAFEERVVEFLERHADASTEGRVPNASSKRRSYG